MITVKKPSHQFKEPTIAPGDNRPSVYNRRISSEQIELPDGRICTRVPARKWSKVKINQYIQFELDHSMFAHFTVVLSK